MIYNKIILFLINNPCEDPNILKVILFIRKILEIAFIIIPIVLIVLITFDFIKSVTAGNEDTMKKNQKIVIKRLVYAVMLFFVIPIVNIVFGAFGTSNNEDKISGTINNQKVSYLSCWDNAKDKKTIESFKITATFNPEGGKVYGDKIKTCGGSISCEITVPNATKKGYTLKGWKQNNNSEIHKTGKKVTIKNNDVFIAVWDKKDSQHDNNPPTDNESANTTTNPSTGAFIGKKYNLSEKELKGLAYLCQEEQGSAKGAAYEAALIANRFELYPKGYDSIYEYAAECEWWSHGYEYVYDPGSVDSDVLEAVKDVLVNGNRPMPQYVD